LNNTKGENDEVRFGSCRVYGDLLGGIQHRPVGGASAAN
jgi:hypothetical protein